MIKNKLKKGGIVALMLAIGISTGSLAWRDLSQYKTAKFETVGVSNTITLIEDFQNKTGWKNGDKVTKKVSVRNGQESDDTDRQIFQPGYVRLQFKEFMQIGGQDYKYTTKRYMIDKSGNFIRFVTLKEAQDFVAKPENNVSNPDRIELVKSIFDDKDAPFAGYYYIATQENDINGQYGKFIAIELITKDQTSIEGADGPSKGEPGVNHNQGATPSEAAWTTHQWDASNKTDYAKKSPFTDYVKWELGSDVILMNDWDGEPTSKWIIDTDSEQGWVYWGQALKHGKTASLNQTLTKNILESVTLIRQPESAAEYFLHVKLDAVDFKDLSTWTDASDKIINGLKKLSDA